MRGEDGRLVSPNKVEVDPRESSSTFEHDERLSANHGKK